MPPRQPAAVGRRSESSALRAGGWGLQPVRWQGLPVSVEEANLEQGDALKSEIESFLDCIRNDRRPIVSGEDGLRALETAIRITEQVLANLKAPR